MAKYLISHSEAKLTGMEFVHFYIANRHGNHIKDFEAPNKDCAMFKSICSRSSSTNSKMARQTKHSRLFFLDRLLHHHHLFSLKRPLQFKCPWGKHQQNPHPNCSHQRYPHHAPATTLQSGFSNFERRSRQLLLLVHENWRSLVFLKPQSMTICSRKTRH